MGNYVSCALSYAHATHPKCPKVLLPGGDVRTLAGPTAAAELMLDNPNHFIVNSRSLHVGRRFFALSADEELEAGEVYVMFPMKRVNSVIVAADMGPLLIAAGSAVRRGSGGNARVIPDMLQIASEVSVPVEGQCESPVPRLKLDGVDEILVGEWKHRLSSCRSRRPLLETIAEETISSR